MAGKARPERRNLPAVKEFPVEPFVKEGERLNKSGAVIVHRLGGAVVPRDLFTEAIKSFDKALHDSPGHFRALKGKAFAHFHLGEYDVAAHTYQEALKHNEDMECHYYLGKCFDKLKKHTLALNHFMKALKIDKGNAPARYHVARMLLKQKRPKYDRIINSLNGLLKRLPEEEPELGEDEAPYLGESNLRIKVSNLKIWVGALRKGKKVRDVPAALLRKFKRQN